MGVPYFLVEILRVDLPTSCRHKKHRDPNSTMSLRKNTSPGRPPCLPPLAPPHPNTNVGIHLALATSNSASSPNANVESVNDAFFCQCQKTSVPGVEKFSARTAPSSQQTAPPHTQQYCLRLRCGGGRAAHGELPPPPAARFLQLDPIQRKHNADEGLGEGSVEAIQLNR